MRKTSLILFFIILAAAALRFYQINSNPKAMYGDGLTLVYDAYSILKTGHDQKGNFLPLVFSLGGGRPAGYVYATIPFVALLGPTAVASQMVSALSGIGIVFLLYLLGKELFSQKTGLFIAIIAALNPWELSLSRGPFETHFALFLTLLGFYSFFRGFKRKYWFILFGLSFALASQTYSTYKLSIPLFTILLLFWTGKKQIFKLFKKVVFLLSLLLVIFSTFLGVYLTISRGNEDRFDIINVFNDQALRLSISQKVQNERSLNNLSPFYINKLHTPQIELVGIILENYFSNFLPGFLFLHGDGQVRHNPAEMGGFFWIDAFLLIIGIIYLYKFNKRLLLFFTGWILIAPLATSLVGGPHALRSSFLLPPLLIFTGVGLEQLWINRKKSINAAVIIFLAMLFIVQFIFFFNRFYFVAPQKNAKAWSYPAKEAAMLALKNHSKFDFIILSNDIDNMEFAYPTYTKTDPNLVIKQNMSPIKITEYKFFKYDNVYIGSLPNSVVMQFIKNLPGKALYIGAAKEKSYLENYKTIRGPDGQEDLVVTSIKTDPNL